MEIESPILADIAPAASKTKSLQWLILFGALFIVIDLKLIFASALPGPWFLPDEVLYINEARSLATTGELIRGTQPGWPLLLSGVVRSLGTHPRAMYFAGVALATTLSTLAWVFGYLLATRWLGRAEALGVTLLAATSPGSTLLGWSVLSEPLFLFLMMMSGWLLVRAVERGGWRDWTASLAASGLCLAVRPFGICCIAATVAGLIVWAAQENRRGLAWLAAGTILAVILELGGGTRLRWTNYPHEHLLIRQALAKLHTSDGWQTIGGAMTHDATYVLVATFGVMWAISFAWIVRNWLNWRRLSAEGRALLVAGCVLIVSMLALSAAMRLIAIDEQMYGRYVEPLAGWAILLSGVAWREEGNSNSFRWACGIALAVGLAAAWKLPAGSFTEMNSGGYWYWHELSASVHTAAACGVCALAWLIWMTPLSRRGLGIWLMLPLSIGSTAAIAAHLHQENRGLTYLREEADAIASAASAPSPPWIEIWIDPDLARGSADAWLTCEYRTWLMRYDLPDAVIGYGRPPGKMPGGVFVLTRARAREHGALWAADGLRLYPD